MTDAPHSSTLSSGPIKSAVRALLLGLTFAMIPSAVFAQQSQNWRWCEQKSFEAPDATIRGCTAVIQAGRESKANLEKAFHNRGFAYSHKRDYDRAIADYGEAIRLNPGEPYNFISRGQMFNRKGDHDRAIADFDHALKLNPSAPFAYTNRGLAYLRKGHDDRAIADFDRAILLDPRLLFAYMGRGNAYAHKGSFDQAIADYDRALGLDPGVPTIHAARGRAKYYKKAYATAENDFREATRIRPADAYAALWCEMAARRIGRTCDLAEARQRIDMTVWPAPLLRVFLGELAPDEAVRRDADREKDEKQTCEATFYLAAYEELNKRARMARELYSRAAEHCPHATAEREGARAILKSMDER